MSSDPATDPPPPPPPAVSEAEEILGTSDPAVAATVTPPTEPSAPVVAVRSVVQNELQRALGRSVPVETSTPLSSSAPSGKKTSPISATVFSRRRHGADGADTARRVLARAVAVQAAAEDLGKSTNPGSGCSSRGKGQRSSRGAMALASLHSDPPDRQRLSPDN